MRDRTLTILKRAATLSFVAVMAALIVDKAREMDWAEVLRAFSAFEPGGIATAFALAIPAYLACACFDLVGRRATGHGLTIPRTMLISYTGYFFSLNLGALVGGLAFRYRLYAPYKLAAATIGQIIALSIVTNWSGYVLIAGALLVYEPPQLPAAWGVAPAVMRTTGAVLLLLAAAYAGWCAIAGGTTVRVKGSGFQLPTLRVVAIQVVLSIVSWGSIGLVVTWLLGDEFSWFTVMPVLMISAIAGIWSHIPSGLGVTEVVFLALLGRLAPESQVLAAILVFRIVYYLAPFALAIAAYAWLEATAAPTADRRNSRTT